jgi:hypothetical protein
MRVCNLFIVVNAFIQYDHDVSSQNDSVCYGSSSSIKIHDSYRHISLYSPICRQFGFRLNPEAFIMLQCCCLFVVVHKPDSRSVFFCLRS